jgi:hypothetical protein
MPSSQSLNLRGKIKHGTEKALLITFNNGRESWVPKSLIFSDFNINSNNIQDFTIPKWFLEKKNILLDNDNPNIIGRSGSVMHLKGRLLRNIYNNTRRSTLSAIFYHFMMNFTGEFLNLIDIYDYYKVLWTVIFVIVVIIIYKPKHLSRSPIQT